MKELARRILVTIALGLMVAAVGSFAQTPGQPGQGAGRGAGGRGGRAGAPPQGGGQGRGGPFAGVPSVSVRGNKEIANEANNILGWRASLAADSMGATTFSDAAAKVDAAGAGFIAG